MRWYPCTKRICEFTGINILALGERQLPGTGSARAKVTNTQVDTCAHYHGGV
jgi:hypothetical protein